MSAETPPSSEITPEERSLAWLADAPMFIDANQIAGLYNAVVKPEHETEKITLNVTKSQETALSGNVGVEGEIGVASWLVKLFPFIDAKAKVTGEGGIEHTRGRENSEEIELKPVNTRQRQLVQLALHYVCNQRPRMQIVYDPRKGGHWLSDEFISAVPRGLVFIDFPPLTQFIPTAVEIAGAGVRPIYGELIKSFIGPKDGPAPSYPEPAYDQGKQDEMIAQRKAYWEFFSKNFNSKIAMEAVEKVSSESSALIRWIDYRVPLGADLPCIHLNLSGQGQYDTGTFAYRLIKRGYKHGLRIVGTMKSEPAINVLAIFEK